VILPDGKSEIGNRKFPMSAEFFQLLDPNPTTRVIALALPDTLDHLEFDALNDALAAAVAARTAIILDLSATTYMGSAVLGLLVNLRQRIKLAQGRLILCGLSPRLRQVFSVSSLERLFTVVKTRQDALQTLG
jgi:anti-anti-sigma factor